MLLRRLQLVLKKRETVCSEDFNLYYFYSKLLTWILAITLDATVILPNMSGSVIEFWSLA